MVENASKYPLPLTSMHSHSNQLAWVTVTSNKHFFFLYSQLIKGFIMYKWDEENLWVNMNSSRKLSCWSAMWMSWISKMSQEDSNIQPQKLAVIVANLVHNEQSRRCFQSVSTLISWIIFRLLRLTRGFLVFRTKMKNNGKIKFYWELEKPPTSD